MKRVAHYYKYNPTSAFSVDWYLGKRCNFSCSYCVDYLHDYKTPHVPLEKLKKVVDKVYLQHEDNVLWSLTGGEPTINPDFLKLCEYIEEKGSKLVSVTTNGSRNLKYHKKLLELVDGITVSFHFEFMSDRIEEYIRKFIELEKYRIELNNSRTKRKKTLIFRFMVETSELETIKYMEYAFRRVGITNIEHRYIRPPGESIINMQPSIKYNFSDPEDPNQILDPDDVVKIESREESFYQPTELEDIKQIYKSTVDQSKQKLRIWYEGSDKEMISEDYHYNELNFNKLNRFSGWKCWAGVKHIKISHDGSIYVGSCHVGGNRGNIYEDNIDLPNEPITCSKWRCTDNTDLKVPKVLSDDYIKLLEGIV
jgi:MoaA/NifB/PqqE/SkfB family radical SAM enzyme